MELREMIQEPIYVAALLLNISMIIASHCWVRMHGLFLPRRKREYYIMGRYVTGTSSILVPFTLICWACEWWIQASVVWTLAILAGFVTGLCYLYDKSKEAEKEAQTETERANHNAVDLCERGFTPPDSVE